MDRERPSAAVLAARLAAFWLPDEVVLYIGLGGESPHAGGWWLKTLSVLDQRWVHWAAPSACEDAEDQLLDAFAAGVSEGSRAQLQAFGPLLPFANLENAGSA